MTTKTKIVGDVVPGKSMLAVLPPRIARDLLFVSSYDTTDPLSPAPDKHGYQRPPTTARFPEIGKYFAKEDNADRIPPIMASVRLTVADQIERFKDLLNREEISTIRSEFGKIASIVDGQHRVGGLVHAYDSNNDFQPAIPVMFYFKMDFAREAEMFNTVNVTQRKLPKALIETNRGDIINAGEVSYAQKIRRIAFSLCRDVDSVWGPIDGKEQVNMTGVRDPEKPVTYEGLRRSTQNMFPPTLLARIEHYDEGLPLALAKRYWRLVSEACSPAWNNDPATREEIDEDTGEVHSVKIQYRIKDLVGVASLAKLGKDILTSHLDSPKGVGDRLKDLTYKLDAVDWEKRDDNPWMRSQAGFAGQKDLYEVLYHWVYSDSEPDSGAGAADPAAAA